MKKSCLIAVLGFLLASCTPADYCESITNEVRKCQTEVYNLLKSPTEAEFVEAHKNVCEQLQTSIEKIKKQGDFRGDSELFNSAIALLEFYQTTLTTSTPSNKFQLKSFVENEQNHLKNFSEATLNFVKTYDLIRTEN